MKFYVFFLAGLLGGIPAGMGMGGGTLLIPILSVLLGVAQQSAQGVNLLAFLPTSAIALREHAKNGFVRREGLLALILPALVCSAIGGILANLLPAAQLRRFFGVFLIILSIIQFTGIKKSGTIGA